MAKIEVTKTELIWPGKYNEDGSLKEVPRVNLPFQVIETVNQSRASREAIKTKGPTLFDLYDGKEGDTFEDGWKNKLIWGQLKSPKHFFSELSKCPLIMMRSSLTSFAVQVRHWLSQKSLGEDGLDVILGVGVFT
jgi:hypothetical protein